MTPAWVYLLVAGCFEVGWPLGFKLFDQYGRLAYLGLAVVSMAVSGFFLYQAQRTISIGTAYAVWTGIGAIGTFLIGIFFFDDRATLTRCFGVFCILAGVIMLELSGQISSGSDIPR